MCKENPHPVLHAASSQSVAALCSFPNADEYMMTVNPLTVTKPELRSFKSYCISMYCVCYKNIFKNPHEIQYVIYDHHKMYAYFPAFWPLCALDLNAAYHQFYKVLHINSKYYLLSYSVYYYQCHTCILL